MLESSVADSKGKTKLAYRTQNRPVNLVFQVVPENKSRKKITIGMDETVCSDPSWNDTCRIVVNANQADLAINHGLALELRWDDIGYEVRPKHIVIENFTGAIYAKTIQAGANAVVPEGGGAPVNCGSIWYMEESE